MEVAELRSFEDLSQLAPPLLQQALAREPDALLAQVFQGLNPDVAKVIFNNLSPRRRALILIEVRRVGRLTKDAVLAARMNVLKHIRGLTQLPPPGAAVPAAPAPAAPLAHKAALTPEQRKEILRRQWGRVLSRLQESNPELRRLAEERRAIVLAALLRGSVRGDEPPDGKRPDPAD